jgi:toxin ParE1/3/4
VQLRQYDLGTIASHTISASDSIYFLPHDIEILVTVRCFGGAGHATLDAHERGAGSGTGSGSAIGSCDRTIKDYIRSQQFCQDSRRALLIPSQAEVKSLSRFPERGGYVKELSSLGIREYWQTLFKPYRVIFRVVETKVIIYLIADGRRDMR